MTRMNPIRIYIARYGITRDVLNGAVEPYI